MCVVKCELMIETDNSEPTLIPMIVAFIAVSGTSRVYDAHSVSSDIRTRTPRTEVDGVRVEH